MGELQQCLGELDPKVNQLTSTVFQVRLACHAPLPVLSFFVSTTFKVKTHSTCFFSAPVFIVFHQQNRHHGSRKSTQFFNLLAGEPLYLNVVLTIPLKKRIQPFLYREKNGDCQLALKQGNGHAADYTLGVGQMSQC